VRFQGSDRRFRIYEKLERLIGDIRRVDIVKRILVAGSFVTSKAEPNDFDCILVLDASVKGEDLRPQEYRLVSRKLARRLYGGDVVPLMENSEALRWYLEFFQTTRDGRRVGFVEIEP